MSSKREVSGLYLDRFLLCSGECTLQDRCLLAMKQPLPGNLLAHHDDDPDFLATLAQGPAHFSLSS